MVKSDAEITKFILKNCNTDFPEDFIKKVGSNSQSSRLATKYEMIENAMIEDYKAKDIKYTQNQIEVNASKAYVYAKVVSGKFLDIRPRTDSKEVLDYIIDNYEDGYKYMLEAVFMKLGSNGVSSYVKGKIEGNSFFTKMAGVTTSQPSEIKKSLNVNIVEVNKIKNLIFHIRAKQDEYRWLNSKIERKSVQKGNETKQYNLNYAQ